RSRGRRRRGRAARSPPPSTGVPSRARGSEATRSALDGAEQALEEAADVRLVDPAHDGDEIVVGIDPDEAAAGAARGPRAGPPDIEPPQDRKSTRLNSSHVS